MHVSLQKVKNVFTYKLIYVLSYLKSGMTEIWLIPPVSAMAVLLQELDAIYIFQSST